MKMRDLEWWIVGFLGLLAFALAFSGYSILFSETGTARNSLDLIFHSAKIFGMDMIDDYPSPLPWQLETARWLAPALVIYATIKAILYLIHREFKSAFIKYYHDHIIIVGLNERSRRLISDLLAHGEKVVVVGHIADVRKLDPIEKEGAVIVEGDLETKRFLRNINAAGAKYIIFTNEDDEKNIENTIAVNEYLKENDRGKNRILFTHISDDLRLNEIRGLRLFEKQLPEQDAGTNCEIKIFSAYEKASRIIFNKYSPDSFKIIQSPDDPPVRIAIIGSGSLAQSFILRIARLGHYANLKKTHVTLFQDGTSSFERLERSFRQLKNILETELIDEAPELFDAGLFEKLHATEPFSAVYILCNDDSIITGILNKLSGIDMPEKINVVVAVNNPESMLSKRVEETNLNNILLHKFNVTDETFTLEGLISEYLDKMAKVVHEDYYNKIEVKDPLKTSHRPWDDLPADFKNQNREQADHIWVKLRALGYNPDKDISSVTIPPDKVELLSEMEHNRWWAFMALNGWVPGQKRDDRRKIHIDLKPYMELPDETKQYDRNAVLNIPVLIDKYLSSDN